MTVCNTKVLMGSICPDCGSVHNPQNHTVVPTLYLGYEEWSEDQNKVFSTEVKDNVPKVWGDLCVRRGGRRWIFIEAFHLSDGYEAYPGAREMFFFHCWQSDKVLKEGIDTDPLRGNDLPF